MMICMMMMLLLMMMYNVGRCRNRDLTLILDSSNLVSASDWSTLTSFAGRLVSDLRRRGAARRVAVVAYSKNAQVLLPLGVHDVSALASLPLSSGHGRNISGALRTTRMSVSFRSLRRLVSTDSKVSCPVLVLY